ncbi:anthranilate synthase component II [Cryptosporangium sp. NPDC048952]|uniref:anthranilate synthase component II n=1 Tax=Cryptosporangium sp. NPDC048952 TaxID=3363961 RepID=UPI00372245F8
MNTKYCRGCGIVDVLVIDHYDSYTWNLVHLIADVTGRLPEVAQHDEIAVADTRSRSHIVLSPGPGRPDDPADFRVGLEILRESRVPVLGVCLGLQGLVVAYGGRVDRIRPAHGEVASIEHDGRGVFRGVPTGFQGVRYHSFAAVEVPSSLAVTARSEDGTVMGVRHRTRPLEGVQFHPESALSEHGRLLMANFLGVE